MKAIVKNIISLVLFVMPVMAFASAEKPLDVDDTIPAEPRCDKYYYTKWFDNCPYWHPKGIYDSCLCLQYQFGRLFTGKLAKWEYAHKGRMQVKGLVAMVNAYTPPTVDGAAGNKKRPEYLYLYQMTSAGHFYYQEIEDCVQLQLLDSVRWDTATARVMEFRQGWNDEYVQYCYLYEAYFEQPVWVDSDFYIVGSMNTPNSGGMVSTFYVDIMDRGDYVISDKYGCTRDDYDDVLSCWGPSVLMCPQCLGEGRPYAFWDRDISPTFGWLSDWPLSPVGYYLPIVDQWNLDAVPNDTAYGKVLGGGRWPDDTYDTIEAVPTPGFHFDSWSDGSTENPRVIHLTSDTSFVAIFYANEIYTLSVTSSDETKGTVTGGGSFYGETDNTIAAEPIYTCKFVGWNDGVTDNPRVVHLTSDTAFVAYFVDKEYYNVETTTNNEEWGTVEGGGVYMEGEDATLTVTTAPFCIFEGWSDGEWQLPRVVTVTQDTLFAAMFKYDSVWAAGIETAGDLDFSVSPNPTTGRLTIRMEQPGEYEMRIYDMNGKAVVSRKGEEAVTDVDISTLPAGQYLIAVRSKDKQGIRTIVKK